MPALTLDYLIRHTTLRQLQVFEAIARLGSHTRAAEELYLTQPTVSMQIKKLSDTIGLPLFEQTGRRIQLTEAGRELHDACRDIFGVLSHLEMAIADMKGLKRGRLRLAVMTTAQYFMPRVLGEFCRKFPGVEVALEVTNREHALERLAKNLDDLYILGRQPDGREIETRPFAPNPLVVMASREHPLTGQRNIPLDRILEEPFLMRESGSGSRDAVYRLFAAKGKEPKVRMELGSNEAIKHAIVAGLGISVLSLHTLTLEGTDGPIAVLDVEGFPIERQWYVAWPRGKELSVVAKAFFDFLMQDGVRMAQDLARVLSAVRTPTASRKRSGTRGR
ncbi:MAG: LysR substrate-binding domain-containing protein [Chromatiales bacterium]|jgi:DNA-binding transcriptional LysR family regulator|nr:LysR substrate-binding domain-containing protein [Chromatiales bacterium]